MASIRPKSPREYPLLSREHVVGLVEKGQTVFIFNDYVIRADVWIPYHPGGDLAMYHMVGKDATDELNALHSPEALQIMDRYRIGRIQGPWANMVPPIQAESSSDMESFAKQERIDAEAEAEASDAAFSTSSESEDTLSRSPSPPPIFEKPVKGSSTPSYFLSPDSATTTTTTDRRSTSRASRHRKQRATSRERSPSPEYKGMDGMAYLDFETHRHIRLDLDKYPSIDPATQAYIVKKYRDMHERVKAEGLYHCHYSAYLFEAARYLFFLSSSLACIHVGQYFCGAVFLGIFWHQLAFFAHDAGHLGITHNFTIDSAMGIFVADVMGGLSLGWWKWSHNVHHIVTNSPHHDPDNQHLPFLAVSHRFFENLWSSYHRKVMAYDAAAKVITRFQAFLYYPILCFGRFNLYLQSILFLARGTGPTKGQAWWCRYAEVAGMVVFWYWFGYQVMYRSIPEGSRFMFVLISHMVTVPLHVQITLSHFAMSTMDLGPTESFPQRMLRTTMDVDCPQWLDWVHGGLQFQAVHHLYPRIPRHNLRKTQKIVQAFCKETGIPYALFGFVDGNKQVLSHLAEVSRQGAILAKCQQAATRELFEGHSH